MKQTITLLLVSVFLIGCSSKPKPLNAPCTYESRSGCGPSVEMQQGYMANNMMTRA